MATSKNHITPENITEWLASTGFLFPRNELELERFDKLHDTIDESITGHEVDPEKIIKGIAFEQKNTTTGKLTSIVSDDLSQYRMVARNGNDVSKSVWDKMKKNQENKKNDDSSSTEKTD